jgi:hypothetical protein
MWVDAARNASKSCVDTDCDSERLLAVQQRLDGRRLVGHERAHPLRMTSHQRELVATYHAGARAVTASEMTRSGAASVDRTWER